MNCKGQKFGHNYIAGICLKCGGNQTQVADARITQVEEKDFFEKIAERKKLKMQHTRHQQDAVETARLFDDKKSMGIYMRLFKRYRREGLIKCREWVDKNGNGNKGRLFVSVHRKFV